MGKTRKLVGDGRTGICASKEILGTVIFSARFWYKMMDIYHDKQIAKSHFNNTVFLKFNTDELNDVIIENDSQYFFKKTIPSDILNICYLTNQDGLIEIDRFKIMLYMLKTINLDMDNILYKALILKIYDDLKEDLANFNEKAYQLEDMPLNIFLKQDGLKR